MTEEKYLLARVTLPIAEDLDSCADRLTRLMPGFVFEEDVTGRYEEVPAFVARQRGMKFVLFGVPDDDVGEEFVLEFDGETALPLDKFLDEDAGGFVRQFVGGKTVNERGFLDCSEELARLLVECGIPGCKPILPVQT